MIHDFNQLWWAPNNVVSQFSMELIFGFKFRKVGSKEPLKASSPFVIDFPQIHV